jgi:hypothetical protein
MRKASFTGLVVAVASLFAAVPTARAQQVVKLGEGETLTISGFVNATLFNDRGTFAPYGSGQNAEFAAAAQPGPAQGIFDGDVRNTRLNLTFAAAPVLGKWFPRATIEADFFGTFAGSGGPPFGDEQPQFRVRHAFADFTNGRTTLRLGQYWAPFFNTDIPVSLVHIAFPVGLGSGGVVGWRFAGLFLYHDLTPANPLKLQLQVAALKGAGGDVGGGVGSGEASGRPQIELRVNGTRKLSNVNWYGYVVYHVDWKNTQPLGTPANDITDWAFETGHNFAIGSFTLHGNFYFGKGLGQQFGMLQQNDPRIHGWGAWAQAGYDFTSHWSLWANYGTDQPDYARFATETGTTLTRQLGHVGSGLLRFRAGRYAAGLEYFRSVTRYSTIITNADQYALSVLYSL